MATCTPGKKSMTSRQGTTRIALLSAAICSSAGVAQSPVSELAVDRAQRSMAIHWPKQFDPGTAPVFSHNELVLHTDCHRAFTHLADATHWPEWFILTKDVTVEGPDQTIQRGTLLRLTIFGSPIESRIVEFTPDSRISWIPFGADETETRHGHYHAWLFVPESGGCRVITEETGIGPNDRKDPQANSRLMHRAHDLWLASLRWVAEP